MFSSEYLLNLQRPICCRALQQSIDMCADQDRSDVNRMPIMEEEMQV